MSQQVKLRDKVQDLVTGYKGVVIGITQWIHGCRRVSVQSQELKDGKPVDAMCFDEPQLKVIGTLKSLPAPAAATTGGPIPAPTRRRDVSR